MTRVINKKLGAGPFRSLTREEAQQQVGYLRPKYELEHFQNQPDRYNPKVVEKHMSVFLMNPGQTKPREHKSNGPCMRNLRSLAESALNIKKAKNVVNPVKERAS